MDLDNNATYELQLQLRIIQVTSTVKKNLPSRIYSVSENRK